MELQIVQQKIFEIRGQKVMFDFDLAALYEVETRVFNQAIKRNIDSFPEEFMFQLTEKEFNDLRSQIVMSNSQVIDNQSSSSSQIVMMKKIPNNRTGKYLPYAFTEHGVTMAASVLKSPKARKMNIAIIKAFVALRKFVVQYNDLLEQIQELKLGIGNHDAQLNQIYEALENLLDEKADEKLKEEEWKARERIGFKK